MQLFGVNVYKSDQKCIFLDPGYGLVQLEVLSSRSTR
jgi:hypothetical protein